MSFSQIQTPQRPLPGAFFQTPAASRYQTGSDPARRLFQQQASTASHSNALQAPTAQQQQQQVVQIQPQSQPQALQPVQRAARTINEVLQRDASFPDLDSYVKQGISSDYDLPSIVNDAGWAPFQKGKEYALPDQIQDQYDHLAVNTMMGLFAELNHAWMSIDNALYLWDYSQTNPELVGFEDSQSAITAVKLIIPRAGVFTAAITHLLVVATTVEILLIGVSVSQGPSGAKAVTLYSTGMSLSTKGVDVRLIEGSSASGRIFFTGGGDNDVFELTYQQEEKWFASRCAKVNHTSPGYIALMPWNPRSSEHVKDIVVDDTRNLLYTLSSESTIRVFHLNTPATLTQVVIKSRHEILRDISHMISQTPLLSNTMSIVSINTIPAKEAAKLHLMAVTSTGCRLFLSATRGYGSLAGKGEAPTSMQVQHIKFPPRELQQGQPAVYQSGEQAIETQSRALENTRLGLRHPPGLFLCVVSRPQRPDTDVMFLSAPDTGRIAADARERTAQATKYYEHGFWMAINGHVEDISLATKAFAASSVPQGFGNELAVQFDEVSTEFAILTNSGVQMVRRRRLVDIFAAAIRDGGGEEGIEGEMKRFIRTYGRGETTAAALAVACGQGAELSSSDSRVIKVADPAIKEAARKAFVEHGGRPSMNENAVADNSGQAIDHVRPSARHEGLALYIGRIVRSLWGAPVVSQVMLPGGAISIISTISQSKLRLVQEDLAELERFLETNSTFIEGLSGPEGLQRSTNRQEDIALQGEHQALHALKSLNKNIVEGISFVSMLFEERVDELWASLDDTTKQRLRELTYQTLFSADEGKDLGKALVKAIVNRNIANGSNVDTVADALRRKCKSFCSADDVLIFKAQEQLKRASELGANTDLGRNVLNESLRLFDQVAGSLTPENLETTLQQYVALQFYAGAIQLALNVAKEIDRGNRALAWVNDHKPPNDNRARLYERRQRCYELVHNILSIVDDVSRQQPETLDGKYSVVTTKRHEAYAVVNDSQDELFQYDLYDWYLSQGWNDRILGVDSDFVVAYLQQKSVSTIEHADLLCRYYAHKGRYYDAASVQLQLAKSDFTLPLRKRIEYLSQAKANASTHTNGVGRQARQVLLHEVSELLEVANIQDDILQKLKGDPRIGPDRRPQVISALDGQVLGLTDLYNEYADQASYFDICLLIYQAADHHNSGDILATWQNLLEYEHGAIVAQGDDAQQLPYEHIVNVVTELAQRLNLSESIFPPDIVIPLLERYAFEQQRGVGSPTWVMDLVINVGMPCESIIAVLENMFYNSDAPFSGRNRRIIAKDIVYATQRWLDHCTRTSQRLFGGGENIARVVDILGMLENNDLDPNERQQSQELRARIARIR